MQALFGKSSYSSKRNVSAARLELEAIFPSGTIRKDDFQRNTALQHCCDIVYNCYNIVAQNSVFANRLVYQRL